jgi:hypothetical protein
MSKVVIKLGESSNYLTDYRPDVECPQWYPDYARAWKFDTLAEAKAFWDEKRKSYELGNVVRFVRHYSLQETRERHKRLREFVRDFMNHAPRLRKGIRHHAWDARESLDWLTTEAGRVSAKATNKEGT